MDRVKILMQTTSLKQSLSKMFKALGDAGINIQLISTSEIKVSCVVDESDAEDALKILHSAKQDLETIHRHFDCFPKNIFDTQIAFNLISISRFKSL